MHRPSHQIKHQQLQEIDNQFQISNNQPSAEQYNKKIIKNLMKSSPISFIFSIILFVVFIISVALTYSQNGSSGNYSIAHISPKVLIQMGGNMVSLVCQGQIYRLFTAILLHGGALHFILNLSTVIGTLMGFQPYVSKKIFLTAIILGGVNGNMAFDVANIIKNTPNSLAIGASTSLCAVIGLFMAYTYLLSLMNGNTQAAKKKIAFMVIYIFLISILPGIDFYGHFGSLISGALLGMSFLKTGPTFLQQNTMKRTKLLSRILYFLYNVLLISLYFY